MLPRPACQRAARFSPSFEYIWISEELTHDVYRRFTANSQATKRHGSFMPGPMECRRRLGKRRMAYASEQHLPTLVPSLSFLWSWLLKEPDNTRWTWEAPRTATVVQAHVAISEPAAAFNAISCAAALAPKPPAAVQWYLATALDEILEIANSGNIEQLWNVLERFISSFGNHIALGRASNSEIEDCLTTVPGILRRDDCRGERANQICLSFYEKLWEAVLGCRGIAMSDRFEVLPKAFLWGLLGLPPSSWQQEILKKVIAPISGTRFIELLQSEISMLVDIWTNTWDQETEWTINESLLKSLVSTAQNDITKLASQITLLNSFCKNPQYFAYKGILLKEVRKSLHDAQTSFQSALQSVSRIEDVINPEMASVSALADLLELLPKELTMKILQFCNAKKAVAMPTAGDLWKHHHWLCLLGDLAVVDEVSFLELWKELKASYLTIEPIFRHWTSRGFIQKPLLVKNTLEISVSQGHMDGADLLYAVSQHEGGYWSRAEALFYMLENVNQYHNVHRIVRRMARLDLRIPAADVRVALETMSRYSSHKAFLINSLQPRLTYNGRPIALWRCPTFITALIHDPRQTSRMIWRLLEIPKELPPGPATTLQPLIVQMIKAFAHSDRPRGSALRSVVSGVWWLQNNNFPITSEVSRAVTHAGIARSIEVGNFIRDAKLLWVVSIVQEGEGDDAAAEMERYVLQWNGRIVRQQEMVRQGRAPKFRETRVLDQGRMS